VLALLAACEEPELPSNTEAYFAAHGIVPGQANELRIGGTLFRFPAGVGLNPYTDQETYRSKDGSPMTLSTKEGIEQGKYEKVATPIVKGRADKVTFHLDPSRDYAPSSSPYGGGIRVEIYDRQNPTWDGVNANLENYLKEIRGRKIIEHPVPGLREYVAPKPWIGSIFEDVRPGAKRASGYGKLFGCQPGPTGFCFISYLNRAGRYMYQIVVTQEFVLEHWPELHPTVVRFVDSVVVK
jgi:hypothetical protein